MTHQQRLDGHRAQIETWLNECFQEREPRGDLYDAMYYSLLAGGKRIRPVLVLETCRMCGGDPAAERGQLAGVDRDVTAHCCCLLP